MILAVDPGTTRSAWVTWDGALVVGHGIADNAMLLAEVRARVPWAAKGVDLLAVEMIASYGMPVGREIFETCVFIGRLLEAWAPRPWRYVYRREVKLELCGSPRAKDANVRQALLDRVGPQGTRAIPGPTYGLKADEWAALGVAVVASGRATDTAAQEGQP